MQSYDLWFSTFLDYYSVYVLITKCQVNASVCFGNIMWPYNAETHWTDNLWAFCWTQLYVTCAPNKSTT